MSRPLDAALSRLAAPGIVALREASGGVAGYLGGDRRRRPVARLTAPEVEALVRSGACAIAGDRLVFTAAGEGRGRRAAAPAEHAFRAQHDPLIRIEATDEEGRPLAAEGLASAPGLARVARLREPDGAFFLEKVEIAAGARLRQDHDLGARGLTRGSDWTRPPRGRDAAGHRGADAPAIGMEARERVRRALSSLAAPLAFAAERVCIADSGLEALEREARLPPRMGKHALKLALAQLAVHYGFVRR